MVMSRVRDCYIPPSRRAAEDGAPERFSGASGCEILDIRESSKVEHLWFEMRRKESDDTAFN